MHTTYGDVSSYLWLGNLRWRSCGWQTAFASVHGRQEGLFVSHYLRYFCKFLSHQKSNKASKKGRTLIFLIWQRLQAGVYAAILRNSGDDVGYFIDCTMTF
jgi:hypothetical protein